MFESNSFVHLTEAQKRLISIQNDCSSSTAYTETIAVFTVNRDNELKWVFSELTELHPILSARVSSEGTRLFFDNKPPVVNETLKNDSLEELKEHIKEHIPAFRVLGGPLSAFKTISWNETIVIVIHINNIIADDVCIHNILTSLKQLLTYPLLKKRKRNISQQYLQAAAEAENMYFKSTRLESDRLYWEDMFTDLPEIISVSLKPFILDTDALVAATFTQNLSLGSTESIECFCKKHAVTEFQSNTS